MEKINLFFEIFIKNGFKKCTGWAPRARALTKLPNLKKHASLSCVVLNKDYEDSVQLFGAFTEFLKCMSPWIVGP
jgi:hypothetical protein